MLLFIVFFLNDPATTEIYTVYNTLSLHDALPICFAGSPAVAMFSVTTVLSRTRRNRSEEHTSELQSLYTISYAVFCLKKTNTEHQIFTTEDQHPLRRTVTHDSLV